MFELDSHQDYKLNEWLEKQTVIARKKQNLPETSDPYYGAIGGEITYSFTPTSLGTIVKVKHSGTDNEIDLSDYDRW